MICSDDFIESTTAEKFEVVAAKPPIDPQDDTSDPPSLPVKRRAFVTEVDDPEALELSVEELNNQPLHRPWDNTLHPEVLEEFRALCYDVTLQPRIIASRLQRRSMIHGGPESAVLLRWVREYRDWLTANSLLPPLAYGTPSKRPKVAEDELLSRLESASFHRRQLMELAVREQKQVEVNGQIMSVPAPNYSAYAKLDSSDQTYNLRMLEMFHGRQSNSPNANMQNIVVSVQVDKSRVQEDLDFLQGI